MAFAEEYIPKGPDAPAYTLEGGGRACVGCQNAQGYPLEGFRNGYPLDGFRNGYPLEGLGATDPAATTASGDTFKTRVMNAISAIVGYSKANEVVVGLEDFIKSRAEEGAKRAVIKYGIVIVALAVVLPLIIQKIRGK